jgi:hypothetical protein
VTGLVVDLFAGGGGASVGIEAALGRSVDIAINHDPVALAVHNFNGGSVTHDRREARLQAALKRNETWAQLSPREQLLELDRRLGKGVGATKQRAKLQRRARGV